MARSTALASISALALSSALSREQPFIWWSVKIKKMHKDDEKCSITEKNMNVSTEKQNSF